MVDSEQEAQELTERSALTPELLREIIEHPHVVMLVDEDVIAEMARHALAAEACQARASEVPGLSATLDEARGELAAIRAALGDWMLPQGDGPEPTAVEAIEALHRALDEADKRHAMMMDEREKLRAENARLRDVPVKAIDVLIGLLPATLHAHERNAYRAVQRWLLGLSRLDVHAAKAKPCAEGEVSRVWWCPHCEEEVPPTDVTFVETHDTRSSGCGHSVESIVRTGRAGGAR